VFLLGLQAVRTDTVPGVLLAALMLSNFVVAVFNLLPGLPLDGGRILRAVVWKITGNPMTGTVVAAWVGKGLALLVLVGMPAWAARAGSSESTASVLMDAVLGAVLAAIIWNGAGSSVRVARLREHLPELRARSLARPAVAVAADTPLAEALRRLELAGARGLVVVDGAGEPVALVRESAVRTIPDHRRPWTATSAVARVLEPGLRIPADLVGEDLLDLLRANPAPEYLVVEPDGSMLGVLAAVDVEEAFALAMSGRSPAPEPSNA
jgi:CBS domain-containing protein